MSNEGMSYQDAINAMKNVSNPKGVTQISNSTLIVDGETAYEQTGTIMIIVQQCGL